VPKFSPSHSRPKAPGKAISALSRLPFCSDFSLASSKTEFQRGETIFSCQNIEN
jgi:hypothetical protein